MRSMLHRTLPLVGVILAACTPTEEPSKPPAAPVVASTLGAQPTASVDAERLLGNIRKLASDDFGGRAPMSDGEVKTLQFLEEKFRQFGLQPLFGDSYRQSVDLVSIDPNPETVQMTFSLKGNDRLVTYRDEMVAVTLRVVPESRVEASEVVFVGYGIVAPEYGWDDYADVDVSGKTVLILVNDPGYATGDADLFKGKKMTYYGRWTYKYEEAANQGAAAAIIVHDTAPAAYGWDVVRNSWTGPQFHLATENDNIDRVAIESWVQKFIAEELAQASGTSLTKLMAAALSPEFQAVALAATMSASVQNELIRSQSYNIGALIPGSEAPEELFIYIAHWDHLGTAKPTNPAENSSEDLIYNGAVDNASGTAALIELAYSFAQLETLPKRSVAFLAVTAEESGLLGSAWYASNPPIPHGANGWRHQHGCPQPLRNHQRHHGGRLRQLRNGRPVDPGCIGSEPGN